MDNVIKLDKDRHLKYGFKAIRLLRERFSKPFTQVLELAVDEVPAFVWAGLVWEDNALTVEKVEEMLDETIPERYTMQSIMALISNALTSQLGVPEAGRPFAQTPETSSLKQDASPSKSD